MWDLVKADRDGEILVEVSDAVREIAHRGDGPRELVAAAETLEPTSSPTSRPTCRQAVIQEVVQALPLRSASGCARRCPIPRARSAR